MELTMDLHERLLAAVNARLEVARAAGADWGPQWMITRVQPYTDPVVLGSSDGENFAIVGTVDVEVPEQVHIAANDPATVIRHCQRDQRVLERHAAFDQANWSGARGSFTEPACQHCELTSNDGDPLARLWPCDEIRALATAYSVEVTDA